MLPEGVAAALGLVLLLAFGIWILWTLIAGAISGARTDQLALVVFGLSTIPLWRALAECRGSNHSPEQPLIECLQFAPIYPLLGLMVGGLASVFKSDADRARQQASRFSAAWRAVAWVLEDGWEQDGRDLRGRYRGHHVEATVVDSPPMSQYDPGFGEYKVSVIAHRGGQRWYIHYGRGWKPWTEKRWMVRSYHQGLATRLEHAGATGVVRSHEEHLGISMSPKVSYSPESGALQLRIGRGCGPNAKVLRTHLDMLVKLTEINSVQNPRSERRRRFGPVHRPIRLDNAETPAE